MFHSQVGMEGKPPSRCLSFRGGGLALVSAGGSVKEQRGVLALSARRLSISALTLTASASVL